MGDLDCYIRLLIHALLEEWVQVSCIISLIYYQDLLLFSNTKPHEVSTISIKKRKRNLFVSCVLNVFFSCEKYSEMTAMFCLFIFNAKKRQL